MQCDKCGQQLNAWNAYCPACGEVAPAAPVQQTMPQRGTTAASSGIAFMFAKLSLVCWVGMLFFSIVNFGLYPGFSISLNVLGPGLIYAGSGVLCALALIFGTFFSVRYRQPKIMIVPLGLNFLIPLVSMFLTNTKSYLWIYLVHLALIASVALVYFVCVNSRASLRPVTIISVISFICWGIIIVVGLPAFYHMLYRGYNVNGFGLLFSSGSFVKLLFFAGTALLGMQTFRNDACN